MKTVLLLTDVNFWEKSSGNRSRVHSLIQYLAPRVQLTVVNTGPAPSGIETRLAETFGAEFFVLEKNKYLSSNGYGRKLKALLKGREFDVTIIEYIHSSYFINYLAGETQLILDMHDLVSRRAVDFARFGYAGALYELSEETEREILSVYDHVMVLCGEDFKDVEAMAGKGKALLCPHPVEAVESNFDPTLTTIAFVASSYLPNVDAINWFIQNCWPQIVSKFPVQLEIYGTICSALKPAGWQAVSLKGFVNDAGEIYSRAGIVINPVRFGAGMKIKNIEALAHGRPLLTTTHGARGIEESIGQALLVADGADDFTAKLELLIRDSELRKEMSQAAVDLVKREFTPIACFKPLMEVINA